VADLFSINANSSLTDENVGNVPLAERLRPTQLADVIGQEHLTGEGMPLRIAFDARKLHSMILWGPPGVGKTSIARLMAHAFDADFVAISAVLSGVKEIREAIERAQLNRDQLKRQTILFVDEVHRFNKSQQDAFLPHVESGLVTFIGATTENPSFELNNALLSRAAVYILKPLVHDALARLLSHAIGTLKLDTAFDGDEGDKVKAFLLDIADGDGRRLLNLLEQLVTAIDAEHIQRVDQKFVTTVLARTSRRFDASLYWFCRMLDGGADPRYLARRLIRMATEDIGLADPRALQIALNASQTYERLGTPEGELALAEAVVYLAIAAKSNAVYNAYKAVRALVQQDESRPVPMHIRNAPTKLMKDIGMGKGYRYAHDEEECYAAGKNYLPAGLEGRRWYEPTDRGLEAKIREKLAHLRALDGKLKS
jgi:putative ATPase